MPDPIWIKTLHVIAVIAWMAGLLYLPRLYVYHVSASPGGELSETLKIMERRLLRLIMNPAMLATWGFGLWAAVASGHYAAGWFHVKLVAVVALTVFHGFLAVWRKDFEADRNRRPQRFYRIANEVPTLIMIVIVVLAVVRPF